MRAGTLTRSLGGLAASRRLTAARSYMHSVWLPGCHNSCPNPHHGFQTMQLLHRLHTPSTPAACLNGRRLNVYAAAPPQASAAGQHFGGGRATEGTRPPRGPRPDIYDGDGTRRRDDAVGGASGRRGEPDSAGRQGGGRVSKQQDWAATQQQRTQRKSGAFASAASAASRPGGAAAQPEQRQAGFLAAEASFSQLGLSEPMVTALAGAGFVQPSRVQVHLSVLMCQLCSVGSQAALRGTIALAFCCLHVLDIVHVLSPDVQPTNAQALAVPAIVAGQDAVVAAETGSGKTLAYLAPLISSLLARNAAQPAADSDVPQRADR